jgi:N4-(beta-N-acetylglucosaminyl)-L-asparaginase
VRRLAHKYPKEARENQVCYVAIDKKGRHGAFSLQPGFNYALYQADENKVLEAGSFFSK